LKITGILNNVFRPLKALKKTRIKLHNTLALPVLLYGSETWTVKARDARRITAAEMIYMRRTAGYTWTDYRTVGYTWTDYRTVRYTWTDYRTAG
jgi:hypothetical protein